jgi:hypothetical protein
MMQGNIAYDCDIHANAKGYKFLGNVRFEEGNLWMTVSEGSDRIKKISKLAFGG